MSWRSDWLYRLIFHEVEQLWQRALKEGQTPLHEGERYCGPPPSYLHVSQCKGMRIQPYRVSDASRPDPYRLMASFQKPVTRQWKFDDEGPQLLPPESERAADEHVVRGMFFRVGSVDFAVSTDRKLVVLQYLLGPRYGRHAVFRVEGQGTQGLRKGRLIGAERFVGWIS